MMAAFCILIQLVIFNNRMFNNIFPDTLIMLVNWFAAVGAHKECHKVHSDCSNFWYGTISESLAVDLGIQKNMPYILVYLQTDSMWTYWVITLDLLDMWLTVWDEPNQEVWRTRPAGWLYSVRQTNVTQCQPRKTINSANFKNYRFWDGPILVFQGPRHNTSYLTIIY